MGREKDAAKEQSRIDDYRALVGQVNSHRNGNDLSSEALVLTSKLLLKNPEYYTVWNYRRQILQSLIRANADSAESLITSDLQYLFPLLKQYPKCYWIWNYRIWLLDLAEQSLEHEKAFQTWRGELDLVGKMLIRDERNFHGWDYRRHVVAQIERLQKPGDSSMVEAEFAYATKMIRKALHNFSALHYRSKLIPRLLDERNADPPERRHMLDQELDLMQEALIDPFNQSAWFYHQFLMSTVAPNCPRASLIATDLSAQDRVLYYEREIDRIKEMLEDFDDCKWIYQALIQYCSELSNLSSSTTAYTEQNIHHWIAELRRLDPMHSGRWNDMQTTLKF